jgi:hypothetical protein
MINRGQIKHHMEDKPVKGCFSNNLFPRIATDQYLRAIWIGDALFSLVFRYIHMEITDK